MCIYPTRMGISYLVGGFKDFLFSIIYMMSSFPLTFTLSSQFVISSQSIQISVWGIPGFWMEKTWEIRWIPKTCDFPSSSRIPSFLPSPRCEPWCWYIKNAQTPRFAHSLLVRGRTTKVLGNIKVPPPLNFTFILHSLKIFNKSLILPPLVNFYIHWKSSIRVQFSHLR